MAVRQVLSGDDRVNVGEWDWEAFEAHKVGLTAMPNAGLMAFLKDQERLERAQSEAREDAVRHARRLCVVVENFLPEAECDQLALQLGPLLKSTLSPSLKNLVLNYSHGGGSDAGESTTKLLTSVSERLWARLLELGTGDAAARALLRELQTAPEWGCRDYHVRHAAQGGVAGEMEMRLRAMSDHVRVMRYSAAEPDGTPSVTGHGQKHEEARDDGHFATDPRNAHHDGRNRRPAGDSFVTALLYLNSEGEGEGEGSQPLEGGHTLFLDEDGRPVAHVAPRKGVLLLFDHHLYHRGERVHRGVKLCLRSDLLYLPCDARTGEPMPDLFDG